MKPATHASAPVDDPGRCIAICTNGQRCKNRELAWMHYRAVAKPDDPLGRLCCTHWQLAMARKVKGKRAS